MVWNVTLLFFFFNRDWVKMGHTEGAIKRDILFVCMCVCAYNACVPVVASTDLQPRLVVLSFYFFWP